MVEAGEWIDLVSGQPRVGAPLGMLLSAQAAATPDRPAMTIGGRSWTFAEFESAANSRARDLTGQKIGPGDRIILSMPNRAEYLQCAFALWKIGAVPCPVSHRLATAELNAIVRLSDAVRIIGQSDLPVDPALLYDIDRLR